jgi:tetratricopeptide (TPR) repeat protein
MLQTTGDSQPNTEAARAAAADARAAADSGDWNGARAAMARAIDISPNDASFHAFMAWYSHQATALPASESDRLSEHHLSVALEIDPNNADAHYVQGMLWANGGNTTRARIALTTAVKLQPDHRAATSALDRLSDKPEPTVPAEVTRSTALPKQSRRAKIRLPLVVAAVSVAVVAAGAFFLSSEGRGAADLAKQLGTTLKLGSVSRVGADLYIDVGTSWDSLAEDQRSNEMSTIARNAGGMGLANVFVYNRSQPVAESHGEAICLGLCSSSPASPAPGQGAK